MAEQNPSGDPRYFYGFQPDKTVVEGHGRRTAENTCGYMLPALLQRAQQKPDLKLLDVGCGPGSISVGLAKYMPDGHVTGVDLSPGVLEKAGQLAKDHSVTNISFQTANIYELPFEDCTFDAIHTHQTVYHCRDAVRAIKELIRVTRKGGIVCMREADTYSVRFWPDSPLPKEEFESVAALMEKTESGWPDAGRRLKAWTVEAGVSRENIVHTAGSWCYDTPEARKAFDGGRMLRGGPGDKVVELGIVTR